MRSESIRFQGSLGEPLDARLELPDGRPQSYALFAHCFACSKDVMSEVRIAKALTDYGIAVLRFDFTGLGRSGGQFEQTVFSSNVKDLEAAAAFLEQYDRAPELLIGHSLGGSAVLAATPHIDSVRAVATIAAPSEPEHIKHLFAENEARLRSKGEITINMMGRQFKITRQFLDDVSSYHLLGIVPQLKSALLLFHSPWDRVVDIDHARRIYEAARHPKSFVSLHNADHLITDKADALYIARVLSAWASRYLELEEAGE